MEIIQQKEKQIKKREPLKGSAKQHQGCQGSHYNGSRKRREREKESKMHQWKRPKSEEGSISKQS